MITKFKNMVGVFTVQSRRMKNSYIIATKTDTTETTMKGTLIKYAELV